MKRKDAEILEELRSIESQLSPENLACDGERPVAQQRKIAKRLRTRQIELHAELGRIPTTTELYDLDITPNEQGEKLLHDIFG